MTGTTRIPLLPSQPAQGAVGEGLGLVRPTLQQLCKRGSQLLGGAAIGVRFPAVPVPIPQPQLLMQQPGIGLDLLGPEGHGPDRRRCPS